MYNFYRLTIKQLSEFSKELFNWELDNESYLSGQQSIEEKLLINLHSFK
jgi:hypothetical protein